MKNNQSKIEKLIAELCLDGVEFKGLGKVVKIKNGKDWKRLGEGNVPVYGTGGVMGYVDTFSYDKPTVLIPRKGSITNIFYLEEPFWNVDTIYYTEIDVRQIEPKFFYYVIKNIDLEKLDTGSGRPSLTQAILDKIKIPIPPLKIQKEIVKILDNFTQLEAELEAELEARRKQYQYYRDKLLSVSDHQGVEFKELGDVCEKTANIKWQDNKNKQFQYIDLTSVDRNTNLVSETKLITSETAPSRAQQIVKTGDIIFGTTRPTLRRFCVIKREYNEQICSTGFCVLRPKTEIVLTNYIFHFISASDFYAYTELNQKGASYPAISDRVVKKYKIPFPALSEQERIVAILDKFDALVNDISTGLPAELNAQRKQYEYYRGKLLTFKEMM